MRNPAHYSRIMLVHVVSPLLCRHNVRKPSCARLSCKRTTLLPHLALEREVWSFVHEYGRNCVHNIGGALVNYKTLGGLCPQSLPHPPPPPPRFRRLCQCSNRNIGTSPKNLFSSGSFDLGFYSCYRFLFLAPPNLFLVHSVFVLSLRMDGCTVAETYDSFLAMTLV